MAVVVRIVEDPAHPEGGHAMVELDGLAGYSGAGRLRIHREGYVNGNLGPGGWQVAEALIEPLRVEPTESGVRIAVGPDVANHVETGPVMISLPDAGVSVATLWPDIAPLREAGSGLRRFGGGAATPRPAPPSPPPRHVPVLEPPPAPESMLRAERDAPEPVPPPARRSWAVPAGLVLVLVAGAAAGAWYYLYEPPVPPAASDAPAPSPAPPAPVPARAADDDSVGAIIARARSPEEILDAALAKQAKGDHDAGFLLLEEAALRGSAPASTALGQLYDPNGFQPGKPFKSPDLRQAARYYKMAEDGGDAAARPPRDALKKTLEQQAAAGNATAQTTLKDFWP